MTLIAALLISLSAQAPAALERVAADLRQTGADVRVSNVEDPKWEIWVDYTGKNPAPVVKKLHGIKRLTAVRIFSDELTDQHVAQMKDLPDLNLLVLMSKKLTDASIDAIVGFKNLEKLDLNKAKVGKRGMRRLSEIKSLRRLYLYNANVDTNAWPEANRLNQITLMHVPPRTPDDVMRRLRSALPNAKIER